MYASYAFSHIPEVLCHLYLITLTSSPDPHHVVMHSFTECTACFHCPLYHILAHENKTGSMLKVDNSFISLVIHKRLVNQGSR